MANIYWVSPTGSESWANAESDTPLSGTSCCSIVTANANVIAGDTVMIRGGTYSGSSGGPKPSASGTAESVITYQVYDDEEAIFTNGGTGLVYGIGLIGRSYIKVDGITIDDMDRAIQILGSSHNEIVNVTCKNNNFLYVNIWDNNLSGDGPFSTHNWIHSCVFIGHGKVINGNDSGGTMQIGIPGDDYQSNYNTVEDCYFEGGCHHHIEVYTRFNVIRNNVFTNDGYFTNSGTAAPKVGTVDGNGLYGNRSIAMAISNSDEKRNLVEGNRLGWSGPPPDDNGANAMVFSNQYNICRFNKMFLADGNGIYMKDGASSSNNFIYNNTVYKNGDKTDGRRSDIRSGGVNITDNSDGSYFFNNLIFDNSGAAFGLLGSGATWDTNTFEANWTKDIGEREQYTWAESDVDPLLLGTDTSDKQSLTDPLLRLTQASPAIDAGVSLTNANGSGTDSVTLVVDAAGFFQDGSIGTDLSTLEGDWVAVGAVDNVAQISSIDYSTNTITLASALTWTDEDDVWLYKDSTGAQVLYGTAPDIGAYQFTGDEVPDAPTGLTVTAI